MMSKQSGTKPYLVEQLKQQHCLWSYDCNSIQDIPDDVLIELVMLYLDIDEINMLFSIFFSNPADELFHVGTILYGVILNELKLRGVTEIYEPEYIDRGYDHIDQKLRSLGAVISREPA